MKKLYALVERLYDKKIDASGLAVFRIFYSIVLLCEVIQFFYFRHLIFDRIPYIEPAEIDFSYALIAWMICIIFLMIGLYTRQAALINYLFSLMFIATISTYEYHMFYAYVGVNFLLIFIPTFKVGSLDRLRLKLKYSNTRNIYEPPSITSVLNYYIIIFVAIGFVYFDSIFFKLTSYNWLHGLGMWLPASLPHVTHTDTSFLLNQKWLALGLGYLTFLFEGVFIFTFFKKNWRVPLLLVGIGLHVGIVIEFPIPWFGLGVIALYTLMIPVVLWRQIRELVTFKRPVLTFYYDEECPLCARTKLILNHFDFFNAVSFKGLQSHGFKEPKLMKFGQEELLNNIHSISQKGKVYIGIQSYVYAFKRIPLLCPLGILLSVPGIYHIAKWLYEEVAANRYVERCTEDNCGYTPVLVPSTVDNIKITRALRIKNLKVGCTVFGVLLLIVLQLNVTYNSALINKVKTKTSFDKTRVARVIENISSPIRKLSKQLVGITPHAVFMDSHFDNYNHILAIEAELSNGKKIWLPIIDKAGQVDSYAYSFNWVKWTFRVNSPTINNENLVKGVKDFTAFWAYKSDINLDEVVFNIYVKRIEIPKAWTKDFLKSQKDQPWTNVGEAFWKGSEIQVEISNIENIP